MATKTMTLTDINKSSKEFKDNHTLQVGGFKDGDVHKITAAYVLEELKKSNAVILKEIKTDRELLMSIANRLDKLEQFSLYVMDVFKRNNLK